MEAASALSTLQAENEEMQKHLNEFSEFLCHMTGGLLSKTNYTAQEIVTATEDYQQRVCGECDLPAENEKLRAELEKVKAERERRWSVSRTNVKPACITRYFLTAARLTMIVRTMMEGARTTMTDGNGTARRRRNEQERLTKKNPEQIWNGY